MGLSCIVLTQGVLVNVVTRSQSARHIANLLIESSASIAVQTVFIISIFLIVQNTLEDNKLSAK
jgi:hypothetical protein